MREILFKAKRADWRKLPREEWWVEGYLTQRKGSDGKVFESWIILDAYEQIGVLNMKSALVSETGFNCYKVDYETVCEYTGLTDKNGRKIFENDICDRKEKFPEIVTYHDGDWTLDYSYASGKESGYNYCNLGFYVRNRGGVEVVGNIFDNPELLEEGD